MCVWCCFRLFLRCLCAGVVSPLPFHHSGFLCTSVRSLPCLCLCPHPYIFIHWIYEYWLNTGEVRSIKIHLTAFFPCKILDSIGRGRYIQMTKMQVENGTCHEKRKRVVWGVSCRCPIARLLAQSLTDRKAGPQWGHLDLETWFYWGTHRSSGPWTWSMLIHKRSSYK